MNYQNELIQIVLAFINADDDLRQKRVIEQHADLLLTDDAHQLLADWFSQSKSNASYSRVLQERQALLARYREASKTVAQEPKPSERSVVQPSPELIEAVLAFVNADNGTERKGLVLARGDLLLSDAADQLLADWVSQSKGNDQYTRILQERRTLLAHYRHEATSHKPPSPPREKVRQAVREFVDATSAAKRKQIVLAQQEVLLTDAAAHFLADWIEAEEESNILHHLQTCQALLTACREKGIESAFATRSQQSKRTRRPTAPPANLVSLRAEISQLTRPQEMERRALLCQQALSLVSRESQAEIWATLQVELANSLIQNPLGNRAQNLEQAISHYKQVLQVYTKEAFPSQWAIMQNNLANAYIYRIRGERAQNLEQAIFHAKQAQKVMTKEASAFHWAGTQNNLANAYNQRIRGERGKNLELAILHYKQALQVYTKNAFPFQWAATHNNLANAYNQRIRGERGENLELAILHYKKTIEFFTKKTYPFEWAMTQSNLAAAYLNRIREERAQNLEQAIFHAKQALQVYTKETFPEQWANTQNNLTAIYCDRVKGERALNLEQAISHAKQALQVYTQDATPNEWATTHNNLANTYSDRIRGERTENLKQAIKHYKKALQVYTQKAFPERWATTQNNLANAYRRTTREKQVLNLEQAIKHYKKALQVYTKEAFPEWWAVTQNNLALAYRKRIRGKRALNLEQAIFHTRQALQVYTKEAFPFDWAGAQNNLAAAYLDRIKGERAENLEQAIFHAKQALEVRTPTSFPQDGRDTAYALGLLLYNEERYSKARQAFEIAHQAVEALRGEVTREGGKKKLASENADLYARLVFCCLREGDEKAAFECAAAGKGRVFVDMLASAQINLTNLPNELQKKVNKASHLKGQLDMIRARLIGESAGSLGSLAEREALNAQLDKLREQDNELWDNIRFEHPDYFATQASEPLALDDAQELARTLNATLVSFYRHADGWVAFVIRPDEENLRVVPLAVTNEQLEEWGNRFYKGLSKRADNNQPWLPDLYNAIIAPLRQHLPPANSDNPARLVLAPASKLHLFPLAALPYEVKEGEYRYLADDYVVSITPNLALLKRVVARNKKARRKVCALAYQGKPGSKHYLFNVVHEVRAVASCFAKDNRLRLRGAKATPQAAIKHGPSYHVVHYACHGQFEMDNVSQSGLLLAGGWLRVRDIFNELRLPDASLAVLSACVTGQVELRGGDELTGLVQAFMYAGTPAVIASLWPVNDSATRHLFKHFYTNYTAGMAASDALRIAQQKLRSQGKQHPYYWAAFQPIGAVF